MTNRYYAPLGETVLEETLPNGLRIFIFPKAGFEKNFAFFATNYGGMDTRFFHNAVWQESPLGVAHFLEHKMFDMPEGNALQTLSGNGASPNAFTSSALTGYYFEGTEGFAENLETLLTFVSQGYFTEESVAKEQGIIGQEIQMIEDNPNWRVYTNLMQALYEHHTARLSVAGTKESISHITAQTLYDCHNAFYYPANMVLCVAGDINPRTVTETAKRILSPEKRSPQSRYMGKTESYAVNEPEISLEMEVSTPIFQVGVKLIAENTGRGRLEQTLLGEILCEVWLGTSSPLYAQLYEQGLLNRSFYCGYESYPGAAFLVAGGESRDPKAVRAAILAEAKRLLAEGIDETLFERVKKAAYGKQVRAMNSFEHLCVEQARAYFAEEDLWHFPQMYDRITVSDLVSALQDWVRADRIALSQILPKGAEA